MDPADTVTDRSDPRFRPFKISFPDTTLTEKLDSLMAHLNRIPSLGGARIDARGEYQDGGYGALLVATPAGVGAEAGDAERHQRPDRFGLRSHPVARSLADRPTGEVPTSPRIPPA